MDHSYQWFIVEDARHTDPTLIDGRRQDERTFGTWPMARIGDDTQADLPLLTDRGRGRDRGRIGLRGPGSPTVEQARVPDSMRDIAQQFGG